MTYRWREHCGPEFDDNLGYRSTDEVSFWKEKDPIAKLSLALEQVLPDFKSIIASEVLKIKSDIDAAFDFAEESPFPENKEAFIGVFANE